MFAALKVINDSLLKAPNTTNISAATKIVQVEWFQISSKDDANAMAVEDYVDCFEEFSPRLLRFMINLADTNVSVTYFLYALLDLYVYWFVCPILQGNTAMHYAVSHGNFDVVSVLLDSKQCDVNQINNAGYTSVMLVSLAKLKVSAHHSVVQRLFRLSDVNIQAKKVSRQIFSYLINVLLHNN